MFPMVYVISRFFSVKVVDLALYILCFIYLYEEGQRAMARGTRGPIGRLRSPSPVCFAIRCQIIFPLTD